jgi:hypothetical protein
VSPVQEHNQILSARGRLALLITCLLGSAVLLAGAASARADFGDGVAIHNFEAYPTTTQAGGHPDLWIEFDIENRYFPQLRDPEDPEKFLPCACNDAKDITVNLPGGFIGNPHATPQCNAKQFAFDECPIDSQIGVATPAGCLGAAICSANPEPVNNLVPPPGVAGLIGFKVVIFNSPVYTELTARTGSDYGLRATVKGVQRTLPVTHFLQVLWGTPADPVHDAWRFAKPCVLLCIAQPPTTGYSSNSPLRPFLSNPTTCGEPLKSTLDIDAYDGGHTHAESPWPTTTGCDQLSFNPSQAIKPTTTEADAPSGADFILTVPQFESPTVPSPSQLRGAVVTLPDGFSIAPNLTNGKTTCTDAEARFGTEEQAQCPEHAKIGSISVETPVLPGPLTGYVYLGESLPGDRYRMFLVFDGFGLHIKLPGSVRPDPATGQIAIHFDELPQAPFARFDMHIFGSERGPLATPTRCGSYEVKSVFTPWDSVLPQQTSRQIFTIDRGPGGRPCPADPRPFDPGFQAAGAGNTGGSHTSFSVDLSRNDGDQFLSGLTVTTPPGFSATLKGIPYCPEAAIAQLSDPLYSGNSELMSSTCPAASQVGTLTAGIGAGTHPLYQNGKVYLAGPYKGAPMSLEIVIPAVSGPYDLGNVATRAAIEVDPNTAQITTVSDPLPQIVEGIPLRTRQIRLNLDRPDFVLNPTNCAPLSVAATVGGAEGASVVRSSHYQAANCALLEFEPELQLRMGGAIKRRGHPAIHAVLKAAPGEANIDRVAVTLPANELVDQTHLNAPCTRPQFAAGSCPSSTVLGSAEAHTPILDKALSGPVYLVTGDHKLPDLVVTLHGQVDVTLRGRIDSTKQGGIRTTFANVPDVPVTDFRLDLAGGKKGLITNSEDSCRHLGRARVQMRGQNNRRSNRRVRIQVPCGKKTRRQRIALHRVVRGGRK